MNTSTLMWGMIFGAIGLGFVVYSKKQKAIIPLLCGIGLMVVPYFISNIYILILSGIVLVALPFIIKIYMSVDQMKDRLPKLSDFPEGTEFIIKEFDVPLVNIPGKGWFNWWGGKPRQYDVTMLKPGNNWEADSFEHWLKIVEESI
jgi:hypothetical protein